MNFSDLGFVRVAAAAPVPALGEPFTNAERILEAARAAEADGAMLILLPELSITGYTCEDLFFSRKLLADSAAALGRIAAAKLDIALVVGAPWQLADGRLLNCAFVIDGDGVRGAVPKSEQPNYQEFYERRWFVSGRDVDEIAEPAGLGAFRIAPRQLFAMPGVTFAIEVCEDLWSPLPIGAEHAVAGAELILNPSASNELVAKADYRRDLVRMASATRLAGYLYASAGPLESTKDVVFGGHLMAAEDGAVLAESERFLLDGSRLTADLDIGHLRHDRGRNITFADAPRTARYMRVATGRARPLTTLERAVSATPFMPGDEAERQARAAEILSIQATGLARRMLAARIDTLVLAVSGGLDSTLAFLVCLDALELRGLDATHLEALTMPGPGTSGHTRKSVGALAEATGVALREIPITAAVTQHLADLGHGGAHDVVFENAQARERTQLLFNRANQVRGLVVGTGDLSELALGWCTFNGDHMAGYNVNASVPKTLVAYLVRWYARHRASKALAAVLERVLTTPISPELLPPAEDGIGQETEAIIGPYELHDFFLFHFVRHGAAPARILALACLAFAGRYDDATIRRWLTVFLERFFAQQFKRTTLPAGPKIGSVSLSPRGDWRMPDEASASALIAELGADDTSD